MGKWSQYRLRGTVRTAALPPSTLLLERAIGSPTGDVSVGFFQRFVAAKPVVVMAPSITITRVELHLRAVGLPTQDLTAVLWTNNSSVPGLPRLGTSDIVSALGVGAGYAWYSFPFAAPVVIPGPSAFFLGIVGSAVDSSNYVQWASSGAVGGGVAYNGFADPPTTNVVDPRWPWLRIYGY